MPVSKKRLNKKTMKPRKFLTKKSARRYLNRFKWQFFSVGRYHKKLVATMAEAIRVARRA